MGVREKDGERKTERERGGKSEGERERGGKSEGERERGGKSEGERERIMPTSRKPDEFVEISIHRSVDFIYNVFGLIVTNFFTGCLQIGWFWTTC